jgi:hypothetical protein
MATNGLGCLIMTAVIDQGFRERLLAEPAEVVGDFELTNDEQEALTSIRAGSFTEFAARLYRWLEQRDPLHLGHLKDDSSPWAQSEDLRRGPAEVEESPPIDRAIRSVWELRDARPLAAESSRALQPCYNVDREVEFAGLNESG